VLAGAARLRELRLAELRVVEEAAGFADEIAPDVAESDDAAGDPGRADPADFPAPAALLGAEPVTVGPADVLAVLACPGRACAKAVPRPSDAAAAPPVIHSDSLRILASLSSRRAAARCMGSRMLQSPPAGGFVAAGTAPAPVRSRRCRPADSITAPGGAAGNGTTSSSLPNDQHETGSGNLQNWLTTAVACVTFRPARPIQRPFRPRYRRAAALGRDRGHDHDAQAASLS
jgi:hypothetical protein